jgi:hypothetical protein
VAMNGHIRKVLGMMFLRKICGVMSKEEKQFKKQKALKEKLLFAMSQSIERIV